MRRLFRCLIAGLLVGGLFLAGNYIKVYALDENNCLSCHGELDDFDRNGVQTEVKALQDELRALLLADGIMDETGLTVKGTYSSAQVGAFWNYKYVGADGSSGVHNPAYTKALLKSAIDALKLW